MNAVYKKHIKNLNKMEENKQQQENAFVIYGELIRYLADTSNELKFDMYASASAHEQITPDKVIGKINDIKQKLDELTKSLTS